ncbi:MAG: hypothetical protein V3W41_07935 [Planctomycetota bacterium]
MGRAWRRRPGPSRNGQPAKQRDDISFFNTIHQHAALNPSDEDRIILIVDTLGSHYDSSLRSKPDPPALA